MWRVLTGAFFFCRRSSRNSWRTWRVCCGRAISLESAYAQRKTSFLRRGIFCLPWRAAHTHPAIFGSEEARHDGNKPAILPVGGRSPPREVIRLHADLVHINPSPPVFSTFSIFLFFFFQTSFHESGRGMCHYIKQIIARRQGVPSFPVCSFPTENFSRPSSVLPAHAHVCRAA